MLCRFRARNVCMYEQALYNIVLRQTINTNGRYVWIDNVRTTRRVVTTDKEGGSFLSRPKCVAETFVFVRPSQIIYIRGMKASTNPWAKTTHLSGYNACYTVWQSSRFKSLKCDGTWILKQVTKVFKINLNYAQQRLVIGTSICGKLPT